MTRRLPMSDQVGVDNPVDAVDKPPMTDHVCHGFSRQNPGTLRTYPQPAEAICGHVDDDSMEFRKEGPRENPKPGPDCEGSDRGSPPELPARFDRRLRQPHADSDPNPDGALGGPGGA